MRKVVFLPCHPNMWEGFETIWEQETSNPSNDVRVIPIPTYQVGYEQKVVDSEYVTSGYPDNVELCGINDYNLELEHPDTIYIQNIQDNNNPVFTVHPHFHSYNLRKWTDNLIYIPFDCMRYIDPEYVYLHRVYGNVLAPAGIRNVDKIIVHSENSKIIYLNLIAGNDNSLRSLWNNKITCEHHPRIDILSRYSKDTVPYPSSWNRHLFDAAGNRKEAVLFVTSVFGVLEYNRSHFRKARAIMEEYLSSKSSSTIIWRPHKYLPEIIIKMRPELFDDFRQLLEFYIINDIGIFDEMATPTPSIILSDKYIGDECTVKELFISTGKPVID